MVDVRVFEITGTDATRTSDKIDFQISWALFQVIL
jgi:hypothetical protein